MYKTNYIKKDYSAIKENLKSVLIQILSSKEKMNEFSKHYRILGLYKYSFRNSLLIAGQGGKIALSFQKWKELNRFVKKGEKAKISIFIPIFKKVKSEENSEEKNKTEFSGFTCGSVFDVSQTDGEPLLYEHNSIENLNYDYFQLKNKIQSIIKIPITEDITGENRGYCTAEKIVVSSMSNNIDRIRTLIHETGHFLMGHLNDNYRDNREFHEIEAEGISYMVLSYMGLSTELSEAYIQSWKPENLEKIQYNKMIAVSDKIIKSIEENKLEKIA
ncbi:MAG TPA: hypothetical protein DC057_16245 [Spirochaetia bacterium]|nr:hypothetical protein [Spirochaetia bacterium]